MLFAGGIVALLIWIYLLFGRGDFWRIEIAPSLRDSMPSARIAVILPARDEAEFIGRAVTSLMQQNGPHSVHLFLVDDAS